MNVLVIGSGGREHALAWKIRQSPLLNELYCAPGNPGTARIATNISLDQSDFGAIAAFAREKQIDLTVVGPERPLTDGIVDFFESEKLRIFGPSKAAAALEGSKVFAKSFMKKYDIPTAEYRSFSAEERYDAERYINEIPTPIVVKADGLAAGKGVTVCDTKEHALVALSMIFGEKKFGDAGSGVVIEEFLVGDEASVFALTDGKEFAMLTPAQDHKRILDNDMGKNTGGMGAYAPAHLVTQELLETVRHTIIAPTLRGMTSEGRTYTGCLYVGLMITQTGPKVIEYNCRFGDPETQVVVPLLDEDLLPLLTGTLEGGMKRAVSSKLATAVCVVVASRGYPDAYDTGKPILGLHEAESVGNVVLFHAGTALRDGALETSGGRVLGVTAFGAQDDLEGTIDTAYRAVEKIRFDGMYYRSDIGKKGLRHLQQENQ